MFRLYYIRYIRTLNNIYDKYSILHNKYKSANS